MPRVYAPAAAPPSVLLSEDEAHHLTRVLRLGPGADVVVFDGDGREWDGRVATVTKTSVRVNLIGFRTPIPEPPVRITVAVGVLKGDQMDAVVRDATMLGAAAIQPVVSAHVSVPERVWRSRSTERWKRVAVSSAKQCARAVVPHVHSIAPLADLLAGDSFDLIVLCAEPAHGEGVAPVALPRPRQVLLLIGPEGGWSREEVEQARRAGAQFLDLGPRTIRAERAPVVALSALWTVWGWR